MGRNGVMLLKGYKLSVIRRRNSGELMYNMMTVVNNYVLYT